MSKPEKITCKCVTLWQPWATGIADRLKTIETRPWPTRYRGLLGIHGGRQWDDFFSFERVRSRIATTLLPYSTIERAQRERGFLIAVCELVDIKEYESRTAFAQDVDHHRCPDNWWEPGKRGWILKNIRRIKPIQIRGMQGLWTFSGEVEFEDPQEAQKPKQNWGPLWDSRG